MTYFLRSLPQDIQLHPYLSNTRLNYTSRFSKVAWLHDQVSCPQKKIYIYIVVTRILKTYPNYFFIDYIDPFLVNVTSLYKYWDNFQINYIKAKNIFTHQLIIPSRAFYSSFLFWQGDNASKRRFQVDCLTVIIYTVIFRLIFLPINSKVNCKLVEIHFPQETANAFHLSSRRPIPFLKYYDIQDLFFL